MIFKVVKSKLLCWVQYIFQWDEFDLQVKYLYGVFIKWELNKICFGLSFFKEKVWCYMYIYNVS